MQKTIDDFPNVKTILDKCAVDVQQELGVPVIVFYKIDVRKRTAEQISNAVCNVCGVTWPMILSNKRYHNITIARQMFCWFGYQYLGISLAAIGKIINRDHTTVIHSKDLIADMIETKNNEYITIHDQINALINQ